MQPIVVLCADDYGLADGVCTAIESLIVAGRLSATGCMTGLPAWRSRGPELKSIVQAHPVDVGLHLTLTDQPPLARLPRLAGDGSLPSIARLVPAALARRLPPGDVASEIRAQLDAFEDVWNAPPDFIDGHQHVHLLPTVHEALLSELARRYRTGAVYLRNCVEPSRRCVARGIAVPKALFLSLLGRALARCAAAAGIPMNEGFSGLHDFTGRQNFRELMQRFLSELGPLPLIHVHPGTVDDELRARDTLTSPREIERDYLAADAFLEDLDAAGVRLGRFHEFG